MKAAGNVEDAMVIRKHIQKGLDAIPEEKKVYVIPNIAKYGDFKTNIRVGAVENGEIKRIKVD